MLSSSSPYAAFQPHEQPLEDSASSLQGNVSLIRYNRTHSWLSVCNNRSSPCSHMKAAVDVHRQQLTILVVAAACPEPRHGTR